MDGELVSNGTADVANTAEHCAICIHDIAAGSLVSLVPCNHSFCTTCIKSWATTKLSCPLCNAAFREGRHFSDAKDSEKYETLVFADPERQEPVRDFSCLDFDFYLTMASKLQVNIGNAESSLFSSNGVFSERGGTNSKSARNVLQSYRNRLDEIISSLLQETRFSPEVLLDEMVLMDENMQQLWLGRIPSGVLNDAHTTVPEYEDDEYEDDDDDTGHMFRAPQQQDFSLLDFAKRKPTPSKMKKKG